MGKIYDNWERLVEATLKREKLRELARAHSRDPSLSSVSSDFSSILAPSSCNSESPENETLKLPIAKHISFKELKNATRNFGHDAILAEGNCGPVFKGWINKHSLTCAKPGSGMAIAIKTCNFNQHLDLDEWLMEVKYISQLHHPNLIKIIGYCLEGHTMLLVNEFMPKGSLDNHLFRRGHQCLSWDARIKVAVGAARGLSFLHTAEKQVIQGVFQPSNILLDQDFNVKLSGITLSRYEATRKDTRVSDYVMRTYSYAAPEYLFRGNLTEKCDVYSFGVVLMELISGRQVINIGANNGKYNLVDWMKPYLSDKERVYIDTKLQGQYPQKGVRIVAELALQCVSRDPKNRPCMSQILDILEWVHGPTEN